MYIICFIGLYYLNYIIGIKEINGFVGTKCAIYSKLCRLYKLRAGCVQFVHSLPVKKIQYRLTCQVAKCPYLRANCANCKQTAPITSYLSH